MQTITCRFSTPHHSTAYCTRYVAAPASTRSARPCPLLSPPPPPTHIRAHTRTPAARRSIIINALGSSIGPVINSFVLVVLVILVAFFTLVGCHGLHITVGLLWLGTMMAQIYAKGFREDIRHRFLCFSLFWHALDIIWVAIFTLVYLMGVLP